MYISTKVYIKEVIGIMKEHSVLYMASAGRYESGFKRGSKWDLKFPLDRQIFCFVMPS